MFYAVVFLERKMGAGFLALQVANKVKVIAIKTTTPYQVTHER